MSQRRERQGGVRATGRLSCWSRRSRRGPDHATVAGTSKVVDLSHAFDEKTLYWPTSPSSFELKKLSFGDTPGGWFYAANSLCTPEHGGTHLDAPIHFSKDGKTIDQIPLRQLIALVVLIDVTAKDERGPRLPPGGWTTSGAGRSGHGSTRPVLYAAANRLGEALAGPEAVPG